MELTTVKQQIKSKNLQNIYIFTGDEIAVMDIYINMIAKVSGLEIKIVDSISDIYNKLKNKSFVNKNYCYRILDDKEYMNAEKLWDELSETVGDNIIIFTYTDIDKRNKFYKQMKDNIVQFDYLPEQMLIKYIQKDMDLSSINCKWLIQLCESDYSRILLEVNKMQLYQQSTECETDANEVFKQMLDSGAIYQPPTDAIFECVDAIMKHKPINSFYLLDECYEYGENTLALISVLYQDIRRTLQVQSCTSKDIAKSTGLSGWQIKCAKEHCNYYSTGDLVYMLKLVQKVERGIKTGLIEPQIAMEYILINIF